MGLLKAFGAAATSLGEGLTQAGALKYKEDQLQEQRDWEWKKMEWANDKATAAASTKAHRESYKTLMEQIEKEEGHILDALGGQPNITNEGYNAEDLNARLQQLRALKTTSMGMFMAVSGGSQKELDHLFGAYKKLISTPIGEKAKLTDVERDALARLQESASGKAVYGGMDDEDPMWTEDEVTKQIATTPLTEEQMAGMSEKERKETSKTYDFPGQKAVDFERNLAIVNNVWDMVLAGPEERTYKFFKAYTSDEEWMKIKGSLSEKVGGGTPKQGAVMSDEKAGEILWAQIKEGGAKAGKAGADKIVDIIHTIGRGGDRAGDAIRDLLFKMGLVTDSMFPEVERGTATDEEAAGLATDPDTLRSRGITPVGDEATSGFPDVSGDETTGIIDGQTDRGLIARVDADQQAGYGRKFASTELPPGAMDDTALPPGEMTTTPRGETIETPPAPVEPYDANYVEGRKAGSTNITSMTVGDIAEQYGYNTRVGMMALTYNEIMELMGKHVYKTMSKKEIRERVDKLPFGDKLQRELLFLSLEDN